MRKRFVLRSLVNTTLAALAAAVTLLAPAPAHADTSWVRGGNWAATDGLVYNVIQYPDGLTAGMTTAQAAAVADTVANDYHDVGINFVRYPVNPATVSGNWAVTQAAINELIADGMTVDICCWYVNPQPQGGNGLIWDMATWQSMWQTVDGVYKNNNAVYYEPINEPSGYTAAGLESVYSTFLGFINKSQGHIILGGTGYEDNVTAIGGDSSFNNCLLAVHDYNGWGTHTTDAAWSTDLYNRVHPYQGRTIMTEMGSPTTTGLNFGTANSGNNDICFVRGMCNQSISWGGMGMVWFPAHQAGTGNNKRMFNGPGAGIINQSLINEMQYGWNFIVPVAPVITNKFPATYTNVFTLFAGQIPTFSLSVTGNPPFYYQWRSNLVIIAGATNASYTPAGPPAGGRNPVGFSCTVTNVYGSTNASWLVSVIPAPVASYPRAVLGLDPMAYWRLNEAEQGGGDNGVIAEDYVGGNNGIYTNVVLGQPGYSALTEPTETSARFGYVTTSNSCAYGILSPDFSLPNGSNAEFTVAAWVNPTGTNGVNTPTVAAKGYYNREEYALDAGAPNTSFRFFVRNAAGTAYNANSTASLTNSGQWYHLAGVCDQSQGLVSLYTNGVLAASVAIPTASGITNSSSTPMTIGSRATAPVPRFDQQFPGYISDVAIYNYALNPTQIQTLYAAGVSFPPAGLTFAGLGGNQAQLNWNYGVLQCATNVAGPYLDMTNAIQPYVVPTTNSAQFFRVREN